MITSIAISMIIRRFSRLIVLVNTIVFNGCVSIYIYVWSRPLPETQDAELQMEKAIRTNQMASRKKTRTQRRPPQSGKSRAKR